MKRTNRVDAMIFALASIWFVACSGAPVSPDPIATVPTVSIVPTVPPQPVWPSTISLPGTYAHHLQGVAIDGTAVYWSLTDRLIKTDLDGHILLTATVTPHNGDICISGERVRAAVNFGEFSNPAGRADSWIYQYRTSDLSFVERSPLHEAVYGAGGIACGDGKVLVVGGLPRGTTHNRIYELSSSLGFIAERRLDTGYTEEGIQVATFGDGSWWLGTYSGVAFRLESDLSTFRRFTFDASLGLASLGSGKYYVGRQTLANGHYENIQVVLATMDGDRELRLVTNGLVLKN